MGNAEEGRAPSAVRKSLEPLCEWYRANKPNVKRVAVMPVDYDRLLAASRATLDRNGFSKVGDSIYYQSFELYRKE